MMNPAQVAIKSSSQNFIEIEDIKDDLVILADGSCCLVIKVWAINFGLLSETEQDAIIYAYAGLLNSLTFAIQILIRSKRKDITSYLELLKNAESAQLNLALKNQIAKYRQFVDTTVKVNNVLDKKFYIIIPFSLLELGVGVAGGMLFKKKKGLPYPKSFILDRAKINLYPKRDHLLRQLNRIGLKASQLTTHELIQLFYDIFNPEALGTGKIVTSEEIFQSPMVRTGQEAEQPTEPTTNQDLLKEEQHEIAQTA